MKAINKVTLFKMTILSLVLLVQLTACSDNSQKELITKNADTTLYFGGNILTMAGDKAHYVEVVVEQAGEIVFVGDKSAAFKSYPNNVKQVDLQGKTLMPGFIEPHVHPSIAAILLSGDIIAPHDWNVPSGLKKGVSGHDAYISRLKTSIEENANDNEVLFIWGYHQLWHGELNRTMLNELSPNKPIAVIHRSFHEVFINDKAIELFNITEQEFSHTAQVDWKKGHFFEGGWLALVPKIAPQLLNPQRYKKGLADMTKLIQQNGITTIAEQGFPSSNFDMEYNLLLSEMAKNPPYDVYNVLNGTQLFTMQGSNEQAFDFIESASEKYNTSNVYMLPKQVKLFADGAIYSLAMQMKDGYNDGFEGEWMTPLDTFEQQMNFYWDNGYKINIHANGDLGIQMCLDIVEKLMQSNPRKGHRLTLHHLGYFTTEQSRQMKKLGIEASANPYYLWALADKYSEFGLGKHRAENLVAIKSLQDNNIPFSFHSDFGMAPMEPLTLAWTAVNRITAQKVLVSQDQRIDAYTAMQAITINAARTLNLEENIGSLAIGKTANFTLLQENPLKVKAMHIKDIAIAGVVYHGQLHWNKAPNKRPMVGDDQDQYGCKTSAGYSWCSTTKQCQRPWLLAEEKGFANTATAFTEYCQNK
ncbi:MAG: amidohydrolase [Colwellia sp.]|nr:amidohydrolase [Colwellia sp.]